MGESFRQRMVAAISAKGPLCAGIDPSPQLLSAWGLTDDATGVREFAFRCIEAFCDVAAAVKTNVAFFERFGSNGMAALEAVLARSAQAGLLTIGDAKRGDIESSNEAYAQAWLSDDSPLAVDALTVVPFFGIAALDPFVDLAAATGRAVFVMVRSSNPGGRMVQSAIGPGGKSLEADLLDHVGKPQWCAHLGAVIGITHNPTPIELPPAGFFLVPGLGAQGATAADLASVFSGVAVTSVMVNLSRSLLRAGPGVDSLRAAAGGAKEELAGVFFHPA